MCVCVCVLCCVNLVQRIQYDAIHAFVLRTLGGGGGGAPRVVCVWEEWLVQLPQLMVSQSCESVWLYVTYLLCFCASFILMVTRV